MSRDIQGVAPIGSMQEDGQGLMVISALFVHMFELYTLVPLREATVLDLPMETEYPQ